MAEKTKPKRTAGRPRKEIDWRLLDNLCHIQCTEEEICEVLGIARDTLWRRVKEEHGVDFQTYYAEKSAGGKASLRRRQWKAAVEDGDRTMLIWLGKQYLGQTDRAYETHEIKGAITLDWGELLKGAVEG